ncbi:unnamed protein product [Calypogeia fissa]
MLVLVNREYEACALLTMTLCQDLTLYSNSINNQSVRLQIVNGGSYPCEGNDRAFEIALSWDIDYSGIGIVDM